MVLKAVNAEIAVEHRNFYVPLQKLLKFPESYFCVALKPHWNDNVCQHKLIVTGRDPELFHYVALYLEFGYLPRNKVGDCMIDREILEALQDEADYFQLSDLLVELTDLLDMQVYENSQARSLFANVPQSHKDCILLRTYPLPEQHEVKRDESIYMDSLLMEASEGFNNICSFQGDKVIIKMKIDSMNLFECVNLMYNRHKWVYEINNKSEIKSLTCEDSDRAVMRCALGLSLDHTKIRVKPIKLQKLEAGKVFSIVDSTQPDDKDVIGYYFETYLVDDQGYCDYSTNDSMCCLKNFDCSENWTENDSKMFKSGIWLAVKFAIMPRESTVSLQCFPDEWCYRLPSIGPRRSISESLHIAHNRLFDFMQQSDVCGGVLGVFTAHKYFASGFRASSLEGCDKVLYEAAVSRGIPVSLVWVRVWRDKAGQSVSYFTADSRLLEGQKARRGNLVFVSSNSEHEGFCTVTSSIVKIDGKYSANLIRSVLILGQRNKQHDTNEDN